MRESLDRLSDELPTAECRRYEQWTAHRAVEEQRLTLDASIGERERAWGESAAASIKAAGDLALQTGTPEAVSAAVDDIRTNHLIGTL